MAPHKEKEKPSGVCGRVREAAEVAFSEEMPEVSSLSALAATLLDNVFKK